MKTLFGFLFDSWRNVFYAFHEFVDNAMDFGNDEEDQW